MALKNTTSVQSILNIHFKFKNISPSTGMKNWLILNSVVLTFIMTFAYYIRDNQKKNKEN